MPRKSKEPIYRNFSPTYYPYKTIYERYRTVLTKKLKAEGIKFAILPEPTDFRLDPPFRPENLWVQETTDITIDGPLSDITKTLLEMLAKTSDAYICSKTYREYEDDHYVRTNVIWWREADELEWALYNELEEARIKLTEEQKRVQLDQARRVLREAGEL